MSSANQFHVRYYSWSMHQTLKEAARDFPLLRKVRSRHSFKFIEFVETLSNPERQSLCSGLVKKFHKIGVNQSRVDLTAAEQALVNAYLTLDVIDMAGKKAQLPHASKHEEQLREILDEQPHITIEACVEVKRILTVNLHDSGRHYLVDPDGAVRLSRPLPRGKFSTTIDFGGRLGRIAYWHTAHFNDVVVQNQISICSWMGISSQTVWDLYTPRDAMDVAASILSLIDFFDHESESLVTGL